MESWIYGSGGKGFALCDEMLSHADVHIRTGEVLTGLDLKNICNHESSIQVPNQDVAVNQGLMQLAFSENVGKTISNDSFDGLGGGKIGNQKEFFGEEDIGSKDWNPATYYCGQDSSLIDLKLGSSTDCTDARNSRDSKDTRFFSSFASPIPAKRIRSTISHGQTPFCLVYGCDIDLTSSKDYYKRHKVCEVHSKTAKVIVNGIEQRFCQQCSRFHLLAEFDDGKRSCRKRLAGHNERRRKPQLDIQSGRNGRLFQSYHGILMGTILPGQPSFFCPDIIPSSINGEVKYEDSKWYQRIKLGVETMYSNAQPPVSVMKGQLFPKSFLSSHGAEQQFVLAHGINTLSGNICYENSNQYEQGFSTSSSLYDNESTIDSLSGVSDSGALSLLSSQSQNSSTYSLGIPITQPQVIQGKPHHSMGHISEKLLASRLQTSNKVSSSGLNLVEDDRMGLLVSDASNIVEYETDGTFEFMNTKAHLYHEDEHTVNLLQLSSLLHSAEQRRQSVQLKQDCKVAELHAAIGSPKLPSE